MKKYGELASVVVGCGAVLLSLVLNEWVLAGFTSDGQIDAVGRLWSIRIFDVFFLGIGVVFIVFRKHAILAKLLLALAVAGGSLLVIDTVLYMVAPILPGKLVAAMSPNAQVRFYRANQDRLPWIYGENDRHARPYAKVQQFDIETEADSLGYRNPPGYLEQKGRMDIVLLGDSFVWGTEEKSITDFMREKDGSITVYSLGISGSGIPQWRHNF